MGFVSVSADELHLLVVLFLIYLSDCFLSMRSSGLMLYSWFWGSALRLKHTSTAMALAGHFWFIRPLIPPLGISIRKTLPRCSLGYSGVCSASPIAVSSRTAESLHYMPYDEIETIDIQGSSLKINGEHWLKGSNSDLTALKTTLHAIQSSTDRKKAVSKAVQNEFTLGRTAPEQLSELMKKCDLLNFFCSLYAIGLLVWLPVAICRFPTEWLLWRVGLPCLILHLICGVLFLRAHKKAAPNQKGTRWESFLKMFLCPPMMIRACDVVTGSAPLNGDVTAALMACTDRKRWGPVIQNIWRQSFPFLRESLQPDAAQALFEFSEAYRSALSRELHKHNADPASLEINASSIAASEKYCPRCGAEFTRQTNICSDCDGVVLLPGEKS